MPAEVGAILAAVAVWHFATIRDGHIWNGDACMYLLHARNLVRRLPYGKTAYIHNPAARVGPATYPPVCPALLAPVYAVFGLDFRRHKGVMVLCFAASLGVMSLVFGDRLSAPYLAAAIALIGVHPALWEAKDRVGSDLPFLLFTFASLALIRAGYAGPAPHDRQLVYGACAGVAMYLAYGTRGLGIVLLPALVVYQASHMAQRAPYAPLAAAAAVVFTALALLQHRWLPSEVRRARYAHRSAPALRGQLARYALAAYGLWYSGWPRILHRGFAALFFASVGLGYADALRQGWTITELFPLLYVMAILAWPVQYEMRRFLIPVVPFLVFYAALGMAAVQRMLPGGPAAGLAPGLAVTLLAWYATQYAAAEYGPPRINLVSPNALALYRYVTAHTDDGDVFVFFDPRILALFTGRRTAGYHQGADDGTLWRYFQTIGAAYIGVGPADREWSSSFVRFVDRHAERLQAVYRNADFVLYRITGFPP